MRGREAWELDISPSGDLAWQRKLRGQGGGKGSTGGVCLQMPRRKPLAKIIAMFRKEGKLDFQGEICFCMEMRRLSVSLCAPRKHWS